MIDTTILYGDDVLGEADTPSTDWISRNAIVVDGVYAQCGETVQWVQDAEAIGGEDMKHVPLYLLHVLDTRGVRHVLLFNDKGATRLVYGISTAMMAATLRQRGINIDDTEDPREIARRLMESERERLDGGEGEAA